jgi:hypothetical protein
VVACYLSLTSIATFRFWQFQNGHRNPIRAVAFFGMRDLNVMTHKMIGNEFGRIPSSAMRLVSLFTGHHMHEGFFDKSGDDATTDVHITVKVSSL